MLELTEDDQKQLLKVIKQEQFYNIFRREKRCVIFHKSNNDYHFVRYQDFDKEIMKLSSLNTTHSIYSISENI
jgi:hypothetical protein